MTAALCQLRLRRVALDDQGAAVAAADGGEAPLCALQLRCLPVSLTCGLYGGRTVVDLTAEEEAVVDQVVSATVDREGNLLGEPTPPGLGCLRGTSPPGSPACQNSPLGSSLPGLPAWQLSAQLLT
jgi:hypothetical protein